MGFFYIRYIVVDSAYKICSTRLFLCVFLCSDLISPLSSSWLSSPPRLSARPNNTLHSFISKREKAQNESKPSSTGGAADCSRLRLLVSDESEHMNRSAMRHATHFSASSPNYIAGQPGPNFQNHKQGLLFLWKGYTQSSLSLLLGRSVLASRQ